MGAREEESSCLVVKRDEVCLRVEINNLIQKLGKIIKGNSPFEPFSHFFLCFFFLYLFLSFFFFFSFFSFSFFFLSLSSLLSSLLPILKEIPL